MSSLLLSNILAQTNTDKSVTKGFSTVGVVGHAIKAQMIGRCTEIRRGFVTAPIDTPFITIRVTGNVEAGVERGITDQQLVEESVVCSNTVPQSIGVSSLPIVISGRYRLAGSSFEGSLASSLVINKHNFCELKEQRDSVLPNSFMSSCFDANKNSFKRSVKQ